MAMVVALAVAKSSGSVGGMAVAFAVVVAKVLFLASSGNMVIALFFAVVGRSI
jgi:hypothetical protein